MRFEHGFVVLQGLPFGRTGSRSALLAQVRRPILALLSGLRRGRAFAAGILVGLGIWAPVFAALNDEPDPWVSATSLLFLGLAAISAHGTE